ncbi:uncharacterized protein LOC116181428 [Photinus pyralis]|uniref:uncharacterized protein LOC116181428 n=1 Tax=Photinus pyralis TaxID=7054 RepID=UPI0012677C9A|nr:uncharacterized protein LOC116181428 [Photinus pyralis]
MGNSILWKYQIGMPMLPMQLKKSIIPQKELRTTRESVEKANLEYQKLLSEKEKLSNSANSPDDIFSFHDEFIKRKEDTRKRLIHLFRSILYGNVTISQQKIESKRKHLKYNGEHNYILQELEEISSLIKAMEQLARENKENDPPQETAKKGNDPVAPVEKKVTFDETVLSPPPRRRGRLIQSKPVHIPSDPLQNTKK